MRPRNFSTVGSQTGVKPGSIALKILNIRIMLLFSLVFYNVSFKFRASGQIEFHLILRIKFNISVQLH